MELKTTRSDRNQLASNPRSPKNGHEKKHCQQYCYSHQTRMDWDRVIARVALQIHQSLHLEEVLHTTATAVQELLNCDRVLLYRFTPNWQGEVAVEAVADAQWLVGDRNLHDPCFLKVGIENYQKGWYRAIADINQENLNTCYANFLQKLDVIANLVVPILHESRLWGLLIAHHCTSPRPWQNEEIEALQILALEVGIAVHQAALVRQLQQAQKALEAKVEVQATELQNTQKQLLDVNRDRQRTAATIAHHENQIEDFFSFFNHANELIQSIALPDGNYLFVNRAWLKRLGYPPEVVHTLTIFDLIAEDDRDYWQDILQKLQAGEIETLDHLETTFNSREGEQIRLEGSLNVRLEKGQPVAARIILRDVTQQRQAERQLQEKAKILKIFYDASPLLLGVVEIADDDILHLSHNAATSDFFGIKPENLKGKWASEIGVSAEQITLWYDYYCRSQTEQRTIHFDYEHLAPEGSRWFLVAVNYLGIGESGRSQFSYIVQDISDRKLAQINQERVKQVDRELYLLEHILDVSLAGYWDWDIQGDRQYLSPGFKQMFGYTDSELPNSPESWQRLIFPEDLPKVMSSFEQHVQSHGKHPHYNEVRYHHKDGSTVWVICTGKVIEWDEQNQPLRMVGCHIDITNMVKMRSALQASEMQLSSVLNSSIDGIMAFAAVRNDQNQITDFEWLLSNPKAGEIVGYNPEALIGQHLLELMPGNREDGLFDLYVKVVETGQTTEREFHYNHEGIDCWFESVVVKLGDGFVVTFRNMTAVKESQQKLQKANRELGSSIVNLRQRNTEMLLLGEISNFLQACLSIEEACQTIASLISPLFPHCAGAIFLTRASRNRLDRIVAWGGECHSQDSFYPQDCWALRRGQTHLVDVERRGLRCQHSHHPVEDEADYTLCIPMIAQGETLGLFYLSSRVATAFSPERKRLAQTVSEQIGLAIANLHLRETLHYQSTRDPLTGLFNRRYLEEYLQQELERSKRNNQEIAVIMIDIDHFKRVNDTYGHDAGDYILQVVCNVIKKRLRSSDVACRYGGEEILIVLPESSLTTASDRAETIRSLISSQTIRYDNLAIEPITASFGVATFPIHGNSSQMLIQSADRALYEAKAQGRDRVVIAEDSMV
ncbi:MAG: diguanylate cyclase [Jaaginema sp. PMC 1079.18]|nr:diguanylate cyclase [Jaaginema sp. PMC 1080.18]MEC4851373.1 diguanylate cyclase [Jaaginema sp. PMC 1079.18]MEC4868813.1 diguanylate cyclase [Jaaginema sp. PMC 1078.18]